MIEPRDITKMVQHIVRRDSGKVDAHIMHPMREWALGLFVVGLIVLWGVIFTIALYRVYSDSLQTEVPVATTVIPFKGSAVAEAIAYYEKERATYEAMVGTDSRASKNATLVATTTTIDMTATPTVSTPVVASSSPKTGTPIPAVKGMSKPVTPVPEL